ncbi:MAG TPA: ribonuclease P protein component [Puia sp.]|jgi:ribonuclease P protein component|nr:ribonuclease P protein component [Puia sp.]
MGRFTLGKDQRLKSRQLIERVFREGKSMNVFPFRVYYLIQPLAEGRQPLQAGVGASRRNFKKAVDRNRIKRLTREAYRVKKEALSLLAKEKQLSLSLFFIYTGKELPDHRLVSGKITVALEKIMKETGS